MNKILVRRYLGYFIIVALAISIISVYSISLIRREAYDRTVDILESTNQATRNIIDTVEFNDVKAYMGRISVDDVRITLIRSDGVVIADSRAEAEQLDNHADRPEVQSALNGIQGVSKRYSNSVKEDLVYVAHPIMSSDAGDIIIRSSMSVRKIDAALKDTIMNIVIIGIITFLALSLITYLSERRLIAPFAVIQKAAEIYSSGDLDYYLSIDFPDDARVVAETMNTMAESLKSRLEELTERRNELDAVFLGMTEALVVLDSSLNIQELNHAADHLAAPGITEVRGRSLVEVFRNIELQELAEETMGSTQVTEKVITFEGRLDATFQVRGSRIESRRDDSGDIAIVMVMTDITRIQRLETMRRDFVANVSHELKTPITNVKGFLETLADGAIEDKEAAERFLSIALRNADRLNAILDDLLSLSRLEQKDRDAFDTERRPLEGVVNAAIQACSPKISSKNIRVEVSGNSNAAANINVLLMEQAVLNLVDNAVKYSPENGEVTVELSVRDSFVEVIVSDQGPGIPEKDLPRIFERFYRVDKARSRELGGTGLGLAIVKHIALVHGGSVRVESEPGRGSRFYLLIPEATE